eukprot:COSAG01_NODE_2439_length_7691_cov_15.896470_5_plen_73_part_00
MEDYYSKSPIVLYGATVCDTPMGVSQTDFQHCRPHPSGSARAPPAPAPPAPPLLLLLLVLLLLRLMVRRPTS